LHRDVIILHELHGLTYRECAEVLGVPVGTVKSRLANAFRCLRNSLGGYVLGDAQPLFPETIGEMS
jgi:RNA polymerase sigma-70 factor (ECF subfamily)